MHFQELYGRYLGGWGSLQIKNKLYPWYIYFGEGDSYQNIAILLPGLFRTAISYEPFAFNLDSFYLVISRVHLASFLNKVLRAATFKHAVAVEFFSLYVQHIPSSSIVFLHASCLENSVRKKCTVVVRFRPGFDKDCRALSI